MVVRRTIIAPAHRSSTQKRAHEEEHLVPLTPPSPRPYPANAYLIQPIGGVAARLLRALAIGALPRPSTNATAAAVLAGSMV